jgi:hypothetical protein
MKVDKLILRVISNILSKPDSHLTGIAKDLTRVYSYFATANQQ